MDVAGLIGLIFLYCITKRATAYPSDLQDTIPSNEENAQPSIMIQMGKNLATLPQGNLQLTSVNFAYNSIRELPSNAFYSNLYRNLENVELGHNRISRVSLDAFKELRQLTQVDISSNNISFLEPNTFRHHNKLRKLDLAYNQISFDPEKAFLRSHSLETLVLSNNQITHVFDITFARLPKIQVLFLDSNPLYYISSNSFVHVRHLHVLTLANTGVHRLTETMFRVVPRLVDVTGTTLASKFEPPLKKVRSAQLVKLMNIENFILGDEYDN